jgi:small GTP-binding protein
MSVTRDDIRNVAIVAHVDHGKTTLVDAMLWQSGAFRVGQDVATRVMDSMDLEREKGITILAKNTSLRYRDVKLNIIDTPGHADFGGEVERGLTMVDGVLLLVDSSEGPLPQTRFVLRKALEAKLPVILVVNKVDRPDARVAEVVDEVYELFLDLDADEHQIEFPIVYCNAKAGAASLEYEPGMQLERGHAGAAAGPAAGAHPRADVRPGPPAAGARDQPGRLPVRRPPGDLPRAQRDDPQGPADRVVPRGRLDRARAGGRAVRDGRAGACGRAGSRPGEIIAVAGIAEVTIGETLADLGDPRPLPVITVDEPAMSITIGVNTSPLAGKDGDKITARQIKARLDQELIGNVSLRVSETARPDTYEVQGRGELQLAVLVEMMRREGFEMTVGQPHVVEREIDGKRHEPVERLSVDVPEEHVGTVTQLLAARKGRMEHMINHGTGWVRMDYLVPARGLIGFRTEFLTETRGTGIMHHVFDRWEPWAGELLTRTSGVLVADRKGETVTFSLFTLQERGSLFVGPGEEVYEGMIIGENSRSEDLDVNPIKEKHLTNMRSSTSDVLVRLDAHRKLTLDEALEFVREDEAVEATPVSVRMRKVVLPKVERLKAVRAARK